LLLFHFIKTLFTLALSEASPTFDPILGITKPLPEQAGDKNILTVKH